MRNRGATVIFFASLVIMLFASIAVAELPEKIDNEDGIIGCWFGTHQQNDIRGDIQTISCFKSDHTFSVRFRIMQNGRSVAEQTESGKWELNGNIKTMATTRINQESLSTDKYITDKYLILRLTRSEQHYEQMENGIHFKVWSRRPKMEARRSLFNCFPAERHDERLVARRAQELDEVRARQPGRAGVDQRMEIQRLWPTTRRRARR